jgi:hypothetical protein
MVVAQLVEPYRHAQDIWKVSLGLAHLLEKIGEGQQDASDLARVYRYGVTTIPREKYFDVLLQLLWRMEDVMLGANYTAPEEGWSRAYAELYNEIQRTKIKVNKATIRRVFIIEREEEIEQLRSTISKQKEDGIRVKCISKSKIENTSMLKTGAHSLETLDFNIVDSKYVWLSVLDRNRKIKHGRVVFGKEECDKYKRFYDHLFEEAEEIE